MKAFIIPEEYSNYDNDFDYALEVDIPFTPVEKMRLDLTEKQNKEFSRQITRFFDKHLNKSVNRDSLGVGRWTNNKVDISDYSLEICYIVYDFDRECFLLWVEFS